jgi:hypothetical protein
MTHFLGLVIRSQKSLIVIERHIEGPVRSLSLPQLFRKAPSKLVAESVREEMQGHIARGAANVNKIGETGILRGRRPSHEDQRAVFLSPAAFTGLAVPTGIRPFTNS